MALNGIIYLLKPLNYFRFEKLLLKFKYIYNKYVFLVYLLIFDFVFVVDQNNLLPIKLLSMMVVIVYDAGKELPKYVRSVCR
jgi:hypothetical protein